MLMVPQNAMLYHVLFNCSGYSNLFYRHSGIRQFETAMNLLRILLPNLYPHLVDPLVLDWQARSNSDLVFSHMHHQHVSDPIQGAAGHGETTADQIWWWLLASSGTAGLLSNWIIITKYLGLGIDSQSPKENRQHVSSAQFACCLGTFLHWGQSPSWKVLLTTKVI